MQQTAILSASAIALALGTPTVSANTTDVVDQIVAELSAQGFSRIEIDIERDGTFDVDAYGGGREGDFYFDAEGNLIDVDIDRSRAFGMSYRGNRPLIVDFDGYADYDSFDDFDDWGYDDD